MKVNKVGNTIDVPVFLLHFLSSCSTSLSLELSNLNSSNFLATVLLASPLKVFDLEYINNLSVKKELSIILKPYSFSNIYLLTFV